MRGRGITIAGVMVALGCLWLANGRQDAMLRMRGTYRLNQGRPLENAPPLVAFTTVALGGFRGILADLLWVRAARLQDEGQYFELVQLSDWIVKLEPRFTAVWGFQAWNMAYNVSVLFDRPEDRWRWINHGIRLLRDEGLRYNPGSAGLYFELGWLFQHKIGGPYDPMHRAYLQSWAREMGTCFEGRIPTPETLRPEGAQRLEQVYRLSVDRIHELDAQYGPFDWRLPQAQAVYWATEGLPWAKDDFERRSLRRMIVQSQVDSMNAGTLLTDAEGQFFETAPNPAIIRSALQTTRERIEWSNNRAGAEQFYSNFVERATALLYYYGETNRAEALYDELGKPGGDLATFAVREWTRPLADDTPERAQETIASALNRVRIYEALGEPEMATIAKRMAEDYSARYNEAHRGP